MITTLKQIESAILVKAILPRGQSEKHVFCAGKIPVALFNIRPLFQYNIIHISLLSRIAKLTSSGIACAVILFDNTTRFANLDEEIATKIEANNAMDLFYKACQNYGINQSLLEIIPESVVWEMTEFKHNFLENMLKLVHISANFGLNHAEPGTLCRVKNISYYFDVLLGIVYEAIIKPDFIMTAGEEVNTIWSDVRARKNLSQVFGHEYLPPIILRMADLHQFNSKKLINTSDRNDPFSEHIDNGNLERMLTSLSDHYKKSILNLNSIFPVTGNNDPIEIVKVIRKKIYGQP